MTFKDYLKFELIYPGNRSCFVLEEFLSIFRIKYAVGLPSVSDGSSVALDKARTFENLCSCCSQNIVDSSVLSDPRTIL